MYVVFGFFNYYIIKQYLWQVSQKFHKRGGSNKACSWENFLKKNKKNSMLIRDFRVTIKPVVKNVKVSKNRNEFMKASFLPKSNTIILGISAQLLM